MRLLEQRTVQATQTTTAWNWLHTKRDIFKKQAEAETTMTRFALSRLSSAFVFGLVFSLVFGLVFCSCLLILADTRWRYLNSLAVFVCFWGVCAWCIAVATRKHSPWTGTSSSQHSRNTNSNTNSSRNSSRKSSRKRVIVQNLHREKVCCCCNHNYCFYCCCFQSPFRLGRVVLPHAVAALFVWTCSSLHVVPAIAQQTQQLPRWLAHPLPSICEGKVSRFQIRTGGHDGQACAVRRAMSGQPVSVHLLLTVLVCVCVCMCVCMCMYVCVCTCPSSLPLTHTHTHSLPLALRLRSLLSVCEMPHPHSSPTRCFCCSTEIRLMALSFWQT